MKAARVPAKAEGTAQMKSLVCAAVIFLARKIKYRKMKRENTFH